MIRINLLTIEKERSKRRLSLTSALKVPATQQKITAICSAILLVAGLGVGWWYWSLSKQAERMEQDIVTAQKEKARLGTLTQQVQNFEAARVQLQQRVGLIEELRRGQSGPVHLLDEISRSLPDMVWLSEIKQQGTDLTITGRCTSQTALADFADNLQLGGYFKPVEIVESQSDAAQRASGVDLIRFTVKATFVTPGAAPAADAPKADAAKPR
jgi:type IV pilus assembly protein PilN